jgi:hypothetical protein
VIARQDRRAVVAGSSRGPWFDDVEPPFFAPDGRTFCYKALRGGRWSLVRNHALPDAAFDAIGLIDIEGTTTAYTARRNEFHVIVIGEKEHAVDRGEIPERLWIDRLSGAVVCLTRPGSAYINGLKDPVFEKLPDDGRIDIETTAAGRAIYLFRGPTSDRDFVLAGGRRHELRELQANRSDRGKISFFARREQKVVRCEIDRASLELKEEEALELPENAEGWAAAEGALAWVVAEEGKFRLKIGGATDEGFDSVQLPSLRVAGKRYGYAAMLGAHHYAVVDGRRGEPWDAVHEILIDGESSACRVEKDGAHLVVVNGKAGAPFEEIRDLALAPLRYRGLKEGRWHLVVGDWASEGFDEVRRPQISSDGRTWACRVRSGSEWRVASNGGLGPVYDKVEPPVVRGSRVAYIARDGRGDAIVIDGRPRARADRIFPDPVFSPDGASLGFAAMSGRELWWRVIDVEE